MTTPNFFSDGSPFLKHPLLTPERTVGEIDFVLAQLDLPPGARVLDVGCGAGRHSIELARSVFVLLPKPSQVDALADGMAAALQDKGESLESMLQALREERDRYGG